MEPRGGVRAAAVDRELDNAFEALGTRVDERVHYSDFVSRLEQHERRVRADVAGAARHEHMRLPADVRRELGEVGMQLVVHGAI